MNLAANANHGMREEAVSLIAYVLERFHAVHRAELPELIALARKVEAVHAADPRRPAGLAALLTEMQAELEQHMRKEEMMLFPTMLAGGGGCTPFAIRRMRAEHDDHDAHLARLRRLTETFTPPEGACGSWRALYAGCRKLHDDLIEHIKLENETLFPLFE